MDKNNSSHGLGGVFLRAATADIPTAHYVGLDMGAQSDRTVVVCQLECTECEIVTPHELLRGRWSCVCCGTLSK